ncbi:myo-inositol-1(or 4)-monophosphatase 1, putative [Leishmania tarentolae]|uniref:Inositol-1-monophosphatase n=1 Tax=Leishmania tarentolae TaxID=5689 RepID=A0A640KEH5_LEITA|nr:myo-inositol-1(or 4)-monophosphatase 1, putative [Leishmania tarentolae]
MAQPSLTEDELNDALGLAIRAANTAAFIINAVDERKNNIAETQTRMDTNDIVSQREKQCREEVLNILRVGTPLYAILIDETHGETVLGDGPTWMVSPIDDSISCAHGLFDFSVSIALALRKEPVLGVVCAPRLQEVFTAVKNRGAFSNGQRIHVSRVNSLKQSVVLLNQSCNRSDAAVKAMTAIQSELAKLPVEGLWCNGSTALGMCLVAAGRAELFWEAGVNPWNVAAGVIIVREAGGVVHDVDRIDSFDLTRRGVCCGCSLDVTKHGVELSLKHDYCRSVLNASP